MSDVFQKIDICLTGPICSCEGQDLQWTPFPQADGKYGIMVGCKQCGTEYRIPHAKFMARFVLEKPYPPVQPKSPTKLEVIEGGATTSDPSKPKN